MSTTTLTESEVEKCIQVWLMHAGDRIRHRISSERYKIYLNFNIDPISDLFLVYIFHLDDKYLNYRRRTTANRELESHTGMSNDE